MCLMLFSYLVLALLSFPDRAAEHRTALILPVEVLGENGTTVDRTLYLSLQQSESVRSLSLQVHGVRYPAQASVQINRSPWIPLRNNTVTVAEPGRSFGGIGGAFATLELTLPIPAGTVIAGPNILRFRFNQSDGLASGYRVLSLNFLAADRTEILLPTDFAEDAPDLWKPPHPDEASIRAGKELWQNAQLIANSLPHSARIKARCADCHARDGRDLKYFNFSNTSVVTRSRFHGLTTLQGELIASYIRSLPFPNPGRPWNPPYQPGPGVDEKPIFEWAAGAGLTWVLDNDTKSLPYLLDVRLQRSPPNAGILVGQDLSTQIHQIGPDVFRPDGNLNAREIPIALQLPDWSQWLPRIHPKDAWGPAFIHSEFAGMYDGGAGAENNHEGLRSLRSLLESTPTSNGNIRFVASRFIRWSQARRSFLSRYVDAKSVWSPELTDKVYSTQLWQLMKAWEMTQEFGLEGEGAAIIGQTAESRTWCNSIPEETAPAAVHIPNSTAGVGGGALTNEYLSASWYELQIILNSGNHRHHDRTPVDWVYLIGHFRSLYLQSHQPEPVRLLVAVAKALQSTDPHLGPDDFSSGWRPDQDVDPRIMISANWKPIFKALPFEVRRTLTDSLLSAWMDKTQQYSLAKYLPLPTLQRDYTRRDLYSDISGGQVWRAAGQFRNAGVSNDLVERLLDWGTAYTDRAVRLQYH